MSLTSVQADDNRHPSLSIMPPEVASNIFCQLSSFSDVFALSAVCCRLRDIWLESVNPIYHQIAPRSIPCERAARRFLVDQDGPDLGSPMSAKDVVRMVRNANVIEKAILQFEREIVRRVRSVTVDGLEYEGFYGPNVLKHPPTLTRTERTRFICSYYALWSLMRIDRSEWESRIQAMTSQELYYLREMAKLTQSIGQEEIVPPPMFPLEPPDSIHSINSGQSEKRIGLERRIGEQIQHNSWRFFERDAQDCSNNAKHEGFLWFVVLWDHFQPAVEDLVTHRSVRLGKPSPAIMAQYIWNNGFNE
ncbi:hypothetical protein MMC34_008149 [Xylographa carneopallida]|nr:hypothetical protein [Xylographa carneopallida]